MNGSITKGHAILFNGTSSSGKTTIANELKSHLETESVCVSLDNHLDPIFAQYYKQYECIFDKKGGPQEGVEAIILPNIVNTFHDIISALLHIGKTVIIDHVLIDSNWRNDLFEKIKSYNIYWCLLFTRRIRK